MEPVVVCLPGDARLRSSPADVAACVYKIIKKYVFLPFRNKSVKFFRHAGITSFLDFAGVERIAARAVFRRFLCVKFLH